MPVKHASHVIDDPTAPSNPRGGGLAGVRGCVTTQQPAAERRGAGHQGPTGGRRPRCPSGAGWGLPCLGRPAHPYPPFRPPLPPVRGRGGNANLTQKFHTFGEPLFPLHPLQSENLIHKVIFCVCVSRYITPPESPPA